MLLAVSALAQTRDAIEKQLKSVQQQKEALKEMGLYAPEPEPDCDPLPKEQVAPLIDEAAKAQKLASKLIAAVIEQESGYRACVVSEKGAEGLMQLMPETSSQLRVEDPFDPKANIAAGAAYLRRLLEKYKGDLAPALAAYNAGPETVEKANGVPDVPETRAYVAAILEKVGTKHIDLTPPPTSP
jgi:soluble lytic murein transglycosylase-like protein